MGQSSDDRAYAAAKAHALCRGLDLTEHPHQQALVPDEMRWMRTAIEASGYLAEVERLREVQRAARAYYREFDHLISRDGGAYPEQIALREALRDSDR